jgi:hypothetical protein
MSKELGVSAMPANVHEEKTYVALLGKQAVLHKKIGP